ncbi:protein SIEVE ELEMENT OCCLUSION B-like [Silene latifolia]|uniref:protein SIEVE ELEMENT OCCLUSION B-like n=1 Tax=Silene latifolia TaxID=37657 RepID=UPI003D7752DF
MMISRFGHVDMPDDRRAINGYWIVRCTIVAATQIIVLSSRGLDQYLTGIRTPAEVEKLISLNGELMYIISKRDERERALKTITRIKYQDDVVGIMRVLVTDKDEDMPPLYHGETKSKDHLDVLTGKRVLLLISGIDIPSEDIESIKRATVDTEKDEIVWIPVINRLIAGLDRVKNEIETLQNSMSWYSVQPSRVTDHASYFFELEWGFRGTPMLVLLSPWGRLLRHGALDMVRIWQNLSVDNLTRDMERQLWKKETWNLKLLVNDIIDPIIQKWIEDERYIIMYGGDDIDWIRRFTRQVQSVASDLQVRIEMVYVGNRHNKDLGRGRRVQDVILIEQLSHCLPESSMAYFWKRFDSIIKSKRTYSSKENLLFQEMLRFHSYEDWALLAKGSTILFNGPGQIASNALNIWRDGRQHCYIHT